MLGLLTVIGLALLNPAWWKIRLVKRISLAIPLLGTFFSAVFSYGLISNVVWLLIPGATGMAIVVVVQIALVFSLPTSGIVHGTIWIIRKMIAGRASGTDQRRRMFLKSAPAILPLTSVSSAAGGVASSFEKIRIPEITLRYPNLPSGLENLKILQISDSHLGFFVGLDDLEELLIRVERHKPDLVLVTGDIVDHLDWLPETLRMIAGLKPRLGAYACLGNHEYYRGIRAVRRAFDAGEVPLLVNSGLMLGSEDGRLHLAGVDDPRWMRKVDPNYFGQAVAKSIESAPSDSFRILMCHRPDGFDPASKAGVELTLAGHTHGGQVGFGRRSIFENVIDYPYLWGHYAKPNGSQLYTSAGVGHWLPFRLGCPAEAPLFTITSASST